LVVEKADVYGGTAAVSGGGIWVPCNDQIERLGGNDTREEAMTYVKHLTVGEVPETKLAAYVDNARLMVGEMAEKHDVHFQAVAQYPDYFPDQPGGKPGYRTMQPAPFDVSKLGDDLEHQRKSYVGMLLFSRISMSQVEAHTMLSRGPGWFSLTLQLMLRYWLDLFWRL